MKHFVAVLLVMTAVAPPAIAEQPEDVYPILGVSLRSEAETGRPFRVAVTLGIGAPAGDTLGPGAVELRHSEGRAQPVRPTLHLLDDWWYEAWVEFAEPGEWRMLLWPDLPEAERSEVGGILAPQTITVRRGPPGWLGSALILTLGIGLLAFALAARRPGSSRRKPAPTHGGDSWWWGP